MYCLGMLCGLAPSFFPEGGLWVPWRDRGLPEPQGKKLDFSSVECSPDAPLSSDGGDRSVAGRGGLYSLSVSLSGLSGYALSHSHLLQ